MPTNPMKYMFIFEFETPSGISDANVNEISNEIAESIRSYFKAKRLDTPAFGSITLLVSEITETGEEKNH